MSDFSITLGLQKQNKTKKKKKKKTKQTNKNTKQNKTKKLKQQQKAYIYDLSKNLARFIFHSSILSSNVAPSGEVHSDVALLGDTKCPDVAAFGDNVVKTT